jgi:predicted nucleotidyltransferase component of viral defense system
MIPLALQGGIALRLLYAHGRFSEDLDFTKTKHCDFDRLKTTISDVFTILHVIHEIKTEKSIAGKTLKVKARGPLYNRPLSESVIAVEISERNDVVLTPDVKEIVPMYDDLRPFTIPVMKKEEILAEKVRALMIRGRARDLYDIAFLLKKGVLWDNNLISKKLSYYKKTFDTDEFIQHATSIKNLWQSELHGLVPKLPSFDDVLSRILHQLR